MNINQDGHVLYQELITSSMNKLLKLIPKQLVSYRTLVEKSLEQISQIKDDKSRFDTNANKYFMIYKYGIELKQQKITECCLFDIDKLISLGFLDGYSYDYVEKDGKINNTLKLKNSNRMLIDSIIETIINCQIIEDDSIQQLILKSINSLFTLPKSHIHSESVVLCIDAVFKAYSYGYNNAKQIGQQIITSIFNQAKDSIILTEEDKHLHQQRVNPMGIILQFQQQSQQIEQIDQNIDQLINQYIDSTMHQLVDCVVIYIEKVKLGHQNVPICVVPQANESDDPRYKVQIEIKLFNEIDAPSGKFGWCIICRQPAPFFCKDTRVPVCSIPCKKKHFEDSETIKILSSSDNQEQICIGDCQLIFSYLCKHVTKDSSISRIALLALDYVLIILREYPIVNFKYQLREDIIQLFLLQNKDKILIAPMLSVLNTCIYYYRDLFIAEIETGTDLLLFRQVSNSDNQLIILNSIEQIIKYPGLILEIFTNFDCTIGRRNVVQQIIELLSKIAQNISGSTDICLLANQCISLFLDNFLQQIQIYEECNQQPHQAIDGQDSQDQIKQLTQQIKTYDNMEKQLNIKMQIQSAIQKFKTSPKDCYVYLVQMGLIGENNAKQFAEFLYENSVHKCQLGQYFGSGNQFNQNVLYEYTRQVDLKNMGIVDGLRKYLNLFTLPGEAQQVDRIMNVFSLKYYEENTDSVFDNEGQTYVFSYLLIMLQTDLHNKSVKNKMTFEQFQKTAQLALEKTLDVQYLKNVYQSTLDQPLAIHATLSNDFQPKNELCIISQQAKSNDQQDFIFEPGVEYIKLLMEIVWPALYVCSNILVEKVEDTQLITYALQHSQVTIQLMTYLGLIESSQQFIQQVINLAQINVKNPKFKNYKALQCLIQLAIQNGNALKNNWKPLLELISWLDQTVDDKPKGKNDNSATKIITTIVDMASIDKIMQNTKFMDSRATVDFLQSMIEISNQEISLPEPKHFALQRLVEVTSFNMERIRLVWTQIWNLLREHFVTVGLSQDINLALYAADQLKQLSVKFLQRHEHNKFNFQKDFLSPFEIIYTKTPHLELKEFILSCMRMLAHMCYYNLKSGWKTVFNIINLALSEQLHLTNIAIEVLAKVFGEDLENVFDFFDDIEISLQKLFIREETHIILQGIEFVQSAIATLIQKSDESHIYAFWMQSLAHLCNFFNDSRTQVQEKATVTFFSVLQKNGKCIKGPQYVQIMRGMMKELFHSLQYSTNKMLCQQSLQGLLELIQQQDINLAYNEIMNLFQFGCTRLNEVFAKVSIMSFKQLLMQQGSQMDWERTIEGIEQLVKGTQPIILFNAAKIDPTMVDNLISPQIIDISYEVNNEQCILQSVIQLMFLDLINDVGEQFIEKFNSNEFNKLLSILTFQYSTSKSFNRQFKARYFLKKKGLMAQLLNLPGLLKQEKQSAIIIIDLRWKYFQITQDKEQLLEIVKFTFELLEDGDIIYQSDYLALVREEQERLIINNMMILQNSIIPILNQIQLQDINSQLKRLLQAFITLPPCYSVVSGQCPHCQKCPNQCQQNGEFKKLWSMIQSFQLKILNEL